MAATLDCAEAGNDPKTRGNPVPVAVESRLKLKFPNRSRTRVSQKAPKGWSTPRCSAIFQVAWRTRQRFGVRWPSIAFPAHLPATNGYFYDANVVIHERDGNNLSLNTYTRGKDLSGSMQGAGGIGGMLAMTVASSVTSQHYYYHADGNGNITALINGLQFIAAKYLYDPYGNILSQCGSISDANHYRFSSKEYCQNSGLVYYLYRFYDPNVQRWLSRDPIKEYGGINLFEYVGNKPISWHDNYGLFLASGLMEIVVRAADEALRGCPDATSSRESCKNCCALAVVAGHAAMFRALVAAGEEAAAYAEAPPAAGGSLLFDALMYLWDTSKLARDGRDCAKKCEEKAKDCPAKPPGDYPGSKTPIV
jgi:RHS repeat-associated protein